MKHFKPIALLLLLSLLISMLAACAPKAQSGTNASDKTQTDAQSAQESTQPADAKDTQEAAQLADAKDIELTVFAAASLTESLTEIQTLYEKAHPDVHLIFNFDSSGTLKTQIEEGADCDLFLSAAQKQMDQLEQDLDRILPESRIDLLENQVVLVVPSENPMQITSFADLAAKLAETKNSGDGQDFLFAIGNSDVPVGQYTAKILAYYELDENQLASSGKITYGSNVKEIVTQVAESSVSCGVVYATDAFSRNLTTVDHAGADMCGQVIYPAAILRDTAYPEAAEEFLQYLQSEEAMAVFSSVGFSPAAMASAGNE